MRKIVYLLAFISSCLFGFAQSTTVSLTAQDNSGQIWANGTIRYSFQPTPGSQIQAVWQGANLPSSYYVTQVTPLNSSGYGSFTVPSNTAITPAGSSWNISICPNVTFNCVTINVAVTGATTDITSLVSAAISKPVIPIQTIPKAYNDSEIQTNPSQGGIYYNTGLITPGLRYWDGATFKALAGGGTGTISSFAAPSASWPSWLVPTVTNATTTPSLSVAASAIPNTALQYSSINVNGSAWTLGGTYTLTASATPGGNSGDMQYNNAGAMGGTDNAKVDSSGNITATGLLTAARLTANANNCPSGQCDYFSHTYTTRYTTDGDETNLGQFFNTKVTGPGSAAVSNNHNWTVGKELFLNFEDDTRGIAQAISLNMVSHSIGDKKGIYSYVYNDPGCGMISQDEGCGNVTFQHLQNANPRVSGTLTGGTSTQPTLSISGPFTDGGYLADTNGGGTASAFAGNATLDNTIHNWTIPVTASSLPVSSAICVSSTALLDPHTLRTVQSSDTVTVTCQPITGLGTPNLTVGIAVVGGPSGSYGPPEQVQITAVSGSSVTLSHSLGHSVGFTIFQGGIAGDIISVDSDLAFFGYRTTYVALGSRTGSELVYCAEDFSTCNLPLPRTGETTETSSSAIHLFPAAEITANLNGGGINVEPNTWVASATGHTIETNPPSFSTGQSAWFIDSTDFMCSAYLGGCTGFYDEYEGKHVSGAYSGFVIENHNPCSFYTACDPVNGKLSEPLAASKIYGYHQWNHYDSQPSLGEVFISDPIGTNTDYTYGLINTNAGGTILSIENNQTASTSASGVPANTTSAVINAVDFMAPCLHFDKNSINIGSITCPTTIASADGGGSDDLTLNNPVNGTTKRGLVDNTTGGSTFNGPVKVTTLVNQPCLATDSSGKLVTCSSNNVQISTPTTSLSGNTCTAATTVALANVTTLSTFVFTPTSNLSAVVGWGANQVLQLHAYPTAGNLNWYVCNTSSSGVTPGAATFNVSVH